MAAPTWPLVALFSMASKDLSHAVQADGRGLYEPPVVYLVGLGQTVKVLVCRDAERSGLTVSCSALLGRCTYW